MPKVPFPEIVVRGVGTITMPPLSEMNLAAIRERAELIEDQQTKTDLFRLLAEVEQARESCH